MDLINDMLAKLTTLNTSISLLKQRGEERANTEMAYRIALAEKIGELREKGTPVTIVNDLARGDNDIAKLRFARDVAEKNYYVGLEYINATKLQIKVLEGQIEREWGTNE